MGVFNCGDTLAEAIESIENQSYPLWKMIICDDGSSDNTYDVAAQYANRDPERILLLKNSTNRGLNFTLNRCLEYADTEFVARMDGDDISLPDRFEKLINAFDEEPALAVVSSAMMFFDESGVWGECGAAYEYPQPEQLVKASAHFHAPCMIRTEVLKAVDGYTDNKKLIRVEDKHLWMKIYAGGWRGKNLASALYMMRDDRNAKKRRNLRARINGAYVTSLTIRTLKLPKKNYVYAVRPLFVWALPSGLYRVLHRKKIHMRKTG